MASATKGAKRACIYCRVSSAVQAEEEKVSLGEQLADCERYCADQRYTVVARYQDVKSGATSRRPDFGRMIAAAGERSFDVVVCWKVDRLGRGLFPMARLLEATEPAGITIEAVKEKIDARYLGLFASVGKIELDNIRERTMAARRAYARNGRITGGGVRYGYRLNADQAVEIHPDESKILIEAAERYAAGDMIADICRDFRQRAVPTRSPKTIRHGMAWPEPYLSRLLADEAYLTGERTFGGEPVQYPPIYTAGLWAGIEARRAKNMYRAKRNTRTDYLLQHLLWCRCCELRFTSHTRRFYYGSPNAEGKRNRFDLKTPKRYYRCVGMAEYGYKCRPGMMIGADQTEALVWGKIAEALDDPEQLLGGIRQRLALLESEAETSETREAESALARLRLERLNVARERVKEKIDDATLDVLLAEVDAQMAYWTERADADGKLRADVDAQRRALDYAGAYLTDLRRHVGERLTELTYTERRELLLALIDRIWVDGENAISIEGIIAASAPAAANQVSWVTADNSAIM